MATRIKTHIVIACLLGLTFGLNAQNKKEPVKRTVHMDYTWTLVEDTSKAMFIRYTYMDNGTNIYPLGPWGKKHWTLKPDTANISKPQVLNGTYTWYDKKGRKRSEHTYKDGMPRLIKEFRKSGTIEQRFDYSKKCKNQKHGWQLTNYKKSGEVKFTWQVCKDEQGNWPKLKGQLKQ